MLVPDTEEILWEEICCPLCSNGDEDLLLAVPSEPAETLYRLVRCRHCGMVYVNPRPAPSTGGSRPAVLREVAEAPPTAWGQCRLWLERLVLSCYHGYPPPRTRWWEKLLAALVRPLVSPASHSLTTLPYVGQGRLLDCGCESGWFGHRLQQRGWSVLTMDGSDPTLFRDRSASGPVFHPRLAGEGIPSRISGVLAPCLEKLPAGSLDAIVLGGLLGQVHWPHPLIEQLTCALRPGGLLAVCVPNLDSWGFRTFGMKWFPLDVPRCLLHFTPATLKRLLTMHGLEVTEVRSVGRTGWMRRSLHGQSLPGLFAGLLTRWTVWRKQADSLLVLARRQQTIATPVRRAA